MQGGGNSFSIRLILSSCRVRIFAGISFKITKNLNIHTYIHMQEVLYKSDNKSSVRVKTIRSPRVFVAFHNTHRGFPFFNCWGLIRISGGCLTALDAKKCIPAFNVFCAEHHNATLLLSLAFSCIHTYSQCKLGSATYQNRFSDSTHERLAWHENLYKNSVACAAATSVESRLINAIFVCLRVPFVTMWRVISSKTSDSQC